MALAARQEHDGDLVAHSDNSSQYTSYEYTERLKRAGIAPSRGRTGTALDNAMAESVIATLKPRKAGHPEQGAGDHPRYALNGLHPGVARVCEAIAAEPRKAWQLTIKGNSVAVVSDGSAVLGLGDIGPEAALPVMEGKAMLFKEFAGIDAYPICLRTKDPEEIVATVKHLSVGFGGINLEDISAPRCFDIERKLQAELDIPVFHDDQHGTAVVVLAALLNALRLTKQKLERLKIVIAGAGAAGMAITQILLRGGARDIVVCDRAGVIHEGRLPALNESKAWLARPDAGGADLLPGQPRPVARDRGQSARSPTRCTTSEFPTLVNRSDVNRSKRALEECLAMYRELGDSKMIARVLWGLGNAYLFSGDYVSARSATRSSRTSPSSGRWPIRSAWPGRGTPSGCAYANLGDWDKPEPLWREAFEHFAAVGDVSGITILLGDFWRSPPWLDGNPLRALRLNAAADRLGETGARA